MSTPDPRPRSSLACGYSPQEDRLVLTVTDKETSRSIHFTRRLTSKLINALAHILERSNEVVGKVPAGLRDDVFLLEHIQALGRRSAARDQQTAARADSGRPVAATPARTRTAHLAVKMTIAPTPPGFHLVLFGRSGPLLQARMNRAELHRFLELFRGHAEAAGWNLVMESTWLQSEQSDVVIN